VNIKSENKRKNSIHSTIDKKKLCEHKVPFLWVIDKNLVEHQNSRPSANGQKFCSVMDIFFSWSADAPSQQPSCREDQVQFNTSVRPSVCPSSRVNDFFPSLSFLFRHTPAHPPPPKGTDPRQQKHTTWTKKQQQGRNCPRNYYFYVYGRTNFLLWCVGGVFVSWRVGGGWLMAM